MARVEADKLRDELARLRDELGQLREEAARSGRALREAQARERKASEMLATEKGRAARADRRPRRRAAPAAGQAGRGGGRRRRAAGRRAKDARAVDDARLWLLLETIGQAAVGLRRELALEPTDQLPADFVADAHADRPGAPAPPAPGRSTPTTRPGSTSCSPCPGRTWSSTATTSPSAGSARCRWSSSATG